jgi:hypothetical protein
MALESPFKNGNGKGLWKEDFLKIENDAISKGKNFILFLRN